jgi:molybdate transport system regulatory protein
MPRVRVSIVFESGARIGPGKAKLLESIRDTGSISAAARDMEMSYKRAWVLLDTINRAFSEPVVKAAPGGVGGGGASLTPAPKCSNDTTASVTATHWAAPLRSSVLQQILPPL